MIENIGDIIARIANHTHTTEDLKKYNAWCNARQLQKVDIPDFESIKPQVLAKINAQLGVKPKVLRFPLYKIIAAAIVLLVLSLVIYYQLPKGGFQPAYANDVPPGSSKAILTLSNGNTISLNSIKVGETIQEEGVELSKTTDGKLIYRHVESRTPGTGKKYNTIQTPNAGEYQVALPDGTNVWLNASSVLTYPIAFAANERKVSLTGEAYFEVTKLRANTQKKTNRIPFIVQTLRPDGTGQEVEVLGTRFNVSSYAVDSGIQTTLVEGLVRVSTLGADRKLMMLHPGEQSTVADRKVSVTRVDPEDFVSWKDGYFHFNNEPLENILLKVSRWYDVNIQYENESTKKQLFSGTISKYRSITQILTVLEKAGAGHFAVKGQTVTLNK